MMYCYRKIYSLFLLMLLSVNAWAAPQNARDNFGVNAYTNNDGTVNWSNNWQDSEDANASAGFITVTGGELRLEGVSGPDPSITRTLDLSSAVGTVTFSYDYRTSNNLQNSDTFVTEVASSAAGPFTVLGNYADDSSASESFDITAFASATTTIRIRIVANLIGGTEFAFFDDVNIAFDDGGVTSGSCNVGGETGYWPMDSSTNDSSGNGNNSNFGSVGFNTSDVLVGSASADFNGTSDGLGYSVGGGLMEQAATNISTSFFVKPDALSGNQVLYDEGGGTNGIAIRLAGSNIQAAVREGGAGSQQTITTPFPTDGEWHHIAMVYANGQFTLYLDGVERGSIATGFGQLAGHSDNGGYGARIGGSNALGSTSVERYSGLMDDITYYYSALSAAQIRSISDCAGTTLNAPSITKSFSPSTIGSGATSTLSLSLGNTNDIALTGVSFSDSMPTSITLSNATIGGTCTGVTVDGATVAGSSNIVVTSGNIPANSSCTIDFTVTSSTLGSHNNTTSAVDTLEAPDSAVSNTAALTVTGSGLNPTINKSFFPSAIRADDSSTISFTLTNDNAFALTGVSFSDNMPIAMWLDSTSVAGTCSGFSLAGSLGDSSFSLSGGSIPANSSCTVEVDIRSGVLGTHNNASSGVASNEVATGAPSNTATLSVTTSPSAVCTPGDLAGGSINYANGRGLFSLNLNTAKVEQLTTAPVANVPSNVINSVAVDPRNYIIYYIDNTGSNANRSIFGYDMLSNTHFTVETDVVNNLGLTLGNRGLGSGGASFFGGSLYVSIEDRPPSSDEVVFRLQMSPDGRSVRYAQEIITLQAGTEFGDIVVTGNDLLIFDAGNSIYRRYDLQTLTLQTTAGPNAVYSQGGAQRDGATMWSVSNVIQQIDIATGALIGGSRTLTTNGTTASGSAADSGGCVPTTSRIGDLVWNDSDGDGVKDNNEIGIGNVTIDLYYDLNSDGALTAADDITGDNAITLADRIQTTTTSADGSYFFDNLIPDDYLVVVSDTNNILGGAAPTNGPEPRSAVNLGTNEERTTIDFGYRSFIVIQGGHVFVDNGTGGGTAHDGLKQSGELGIEGATVEVRDPSNGNALVTSTSTDPNGQYSLYIPNSFAGNPLDIIVSARSGFISVSENVSTTGAINPDTRDDRITFTPVAGSLHTNVNFGDVPENIYTPNNTGTVQAGQTIFYNHEFVAGSVGFVTFNSTAIATPNGPTWQRVLYNDADCSGDLNTAESSAPLSSAIATTAGQRFCIINRVVAPTSAPFSAQYLITLTADFEYTGETPDGFTAQNVVNDLTTLAVTGLQLDKTVENLDTGTGALLSNTALPNQRLRYNVIYTNNSNGSISDLVVRDSVPAYTVLDSAITCPVSLPNNLSACSVALPIPVNNIVGYQGPIEWVFTGNLAAGQQGTLSFDVRVE